LGLQDVGNGGDSLFEGVDGVAVSCAHGGENECLEGQAESVGVEVDVVPADRTGLFQGSQAAVAGRKAEADAPGQLGNGQGPSCCSSRTGGIRVKAWLPILIDGSVPNATRCRLLRLVC
jgi:hypothetical protein